jgi:hypothetical protein
MVVAQTSVSIQYFIPGTNCQQSTGQMDSWISCNHCITQNNHPESCDGRADTCGVLYSCDPTTVSIGYWWTSGDVCLRGNPQASEKYPTNTCLPPSKGYNSYNSSDTIFVCNL